MNSFRTIDSDQLDTVIGGIAARPVTPKLKPISAAKRGTAKPTGKLKPSIDLDPVVKYDGWGAYIGDY